MNKSTHSEALIQMCKLLFYPHCSLHQYFPIPYPTHSENTVNENFMLSTSCNPAEIRHPVSNKSIAFRGLFTSGIKSAYDIETSGWMKLSQGTGTAGACTISLQTNKNEPRKNQ